MTKYLAGAYSRVLMEVKGQQFTFRLGIACSSWTCLDPSNLVAYKARFTIRRTGEREQSEYNGLLLGALSAGL